MWRKWRIGEVASLANFGESGAVAQAQAAAAAGEELTTAAASGANDEQVTKLTFESSPSH